MRITQYALLLLLLIPLAAGVNVSISEAASANETGDNQTTAGNNMQSSVKLEIILPEPVLLGVTYDSLFKITNLNHAPGSDSFAFVIVKYNITKNIAESNNTTNNNITNESLLVKEGYFNKTINYYSSSDTGIMFIEETGNYALCGVVLNVSNTAISDTSPVFSVCKEFKVINPLSIPCSIEVNLSTDKELYLEKEQVKIKNSLNNDSYPFIIEYWVEDLFGNEVKARQETSNTNTKAYTSSLDENDKVFLIRNKLVFVACNNSNNMLENQRLIVVKKETQEKMITEQEAKKIEAENKKKSASTAKEETSKTTTVKTAEKAAEKETGKISSFYTLSKNYNEQINLFANIKGNGTYDLVLMGNKGEQKRKVNAPEKMKFGVEPEPGVNLFTLELRQQNKTIDNRTLRFELAKKENKTINKNNMNTTLKNNTAKNNSSLKITALKKEAAVMKEAVLKKNNETAGAKEMNSSLNSSLPATGRMVYESSNVRILKLSPYLIALVIALVVVGLLLSKRR
jgi:hypothetical protein